MKYDLTPFLHIDPCSPTAGFDIKKILKLQYPVFVGEWAPDPSLDVLQILNDLKARKS